MVGVDVVGESYYEDVLERIDPSAEVDQQALDARFAGAAGSPRGAVAAIATDSRWPSTIALRALLGVDPGGAPRRRLLLPRVRWSASLVTPATAMRTSHCRAISWR
jgi:hypothetical protein